MFSASLTPNITIPTRLTVHSRALIDNIFTNSVDKNTISVIFPNQNNKKNYKRNYKNLDPKKFKEELQRINWNTGLVNNNNDVNQSLESFLTIINSLLDKHAPMKQITKKEIKTKSKPWITKGILTLINKKYKIRNKSLKAKDQNRKEALNQEYKMYKNILTNITKKSKENYYKQYFKDNKTNLIKCLERNKRNYSYQKNK